MELIKDRKITIHGLAHITGGSFTKLKRLNNKVRYNLFDLSPPHGIFKQIQKDGIIDLKEMYRTFNMGIGLCMILSKANVDKTISIIEKYNIKVRKIGEVDSKGNGNVIGKVENKKYIFS